MLLGDLNLVTGELELLAAAQLEVLETYANNLFGERLDLVPSLMADVFSFLLDQILGIDAKLIACSLAIAVQPTSLNIGEDLPLHDGRLLVRDHLSGLRWASIKGVSVGASRAETVKGHRQFLIGRLH